ncbi:uncharacterized protein LOC105701292 isoform X2 [Orussus abietinus]|uniref:uncharacterized protein LOC105701292 isoform X2 n=1 Tax=Orussus abietinus TaxID=222816 RepID=UPI00062598C5|nr:uncharacterized protein LOC105701292 isoform X2 [Orussus abietinus]
MPFAIRKVEPRYLCRGHVPPGPDAQGWPVGAEMGAVANGALTASLRQLASLLTAAEDIFAELTAELTCLADRSGLLRHRIDRVEERLASVDPKKIPVPESDICTFATRTEHFHVTNEPSTSLFTSNSRPKALSELYEAAAIVAVRSLDSLRRGQDGSSLDMFLCTPVLGKRRRDQSLDIESRMPAAIEDLRRWTSTEALGDVTVAPDCMSRILSDVDGDDAVDHKLPSPEEQVQAVALKFPAEIVAVDVSGRGFERMSMRRRSLLAGPESQDAAVKRRSRPRRPRGKRRNTIAGTDQKEIRQAIGGETTADEPEELLAGAAPRAHRSASTDILGSKKESSGEKKSHFNTLKAWGMSRLKLISPKSSQSSQQLDSEVPTASSDQERTSDTAQARDPEEINIYETVSSRRRKEKSHERKPSSSSSSGKSTSSIPVSVPSTERQPSVKLRESAAQRRERRKGNGRDDAPHSSSGNWSASSESGRASIGSETTTTTHQPRSTTTASIGTSSTSLSHVRRLKGRDTSASSSVTSEGTLTPDIIQDIATVPFSDDGETSSVYSCDTEGYYTSFHMDSGLKTLREEEPVPQSPLTKSNDVNSDPTSPVVENEYELFGRGSTSTTTSSAGTVCTALMAPPPPERKSSLTVVALVHGQNQNGGESPDSGHNTSSSPVESASSPACTGRSCSEFEYSESSDLEGCERIERIRSKTAINTSRIPSMCVITPPASDDETAREPEEHLEKRKEGSKEVQGPGSILMSATVGTSKMEVINGQDKNLYATVQTVLPSTTQTQNDRTSGQTSTSHVGPAKVSPLSGVLGKLRGVLPGARKNLSKNAVQETACADSGDYVTIADVRNNNDKRPESSPSTAIRSTATYANSDLFRKDAEYVSLSELPKKPDSSLERRRQGAKVTLDSEGKVVYSSDSLKRRKGAHTTFNPGVFVKEGASPTRSPLLHRPQTTVRPVTKSSSDAVDGGARASTSPQLGKVVRALQGPDRPASPDCARTSSTVTGPKSPTRVHGQVRGAYVNVQADEDNAVLTISTETVPSEIKSQPPPYVGPPRPQDRPNVVYDPLSGDPRRIHQVQGRGYPRSLSHQENLCNQGQPCHFQAHPADRNLYDRNQQLFERHRAANGPDARIYALQEQCGPRVQHTPGCAENMQQFYTLPTRRPRREVEVPRSVTPDITRGLGRTPLAATTRQGQHTNTCSHLEHHGHAEGGADAEMGNEQLQPRSGLPNDRQPRMPVDVKTRFATPLGLAAIGYRFFASPSVQDIRRDSPIPETARHAPISPIGPGSNQGFKSSTPTSRATTSTVAERLALNAPRPTMERPGTSGRSTPTQASSGRSTPTNLILSPTKSTMSSEELFAAIHKSKRRLNIRDDGENLSPFGSTNSLNQVQPGTRHSWSPESQKVPEIPQSVQPPSATSRLDFKRLLLQQNSKSGPVRLSAAEQLKLSRQQCQYQQHSQQISPQIPPVKVLSPRSVWRFQTPRSDVLSSTIIEDAAAEEKAMKPSPENPSPISRLNPRRQLDLSSNLVPPKPAEIEKDQNNTESTQERLSRPSSQASEGLKTEPEKRGNLGIIPDASARSYITAESLIDKVLFDRNNRNASEIKALADQSEILQAAQNAADGLPAASTASVSTPRRETALNSVESRRLSNQLARAQFLAAMPGNGRQAQSENPLFQKRFRARSESPQHAITQNVARSPSAPTLETAL